MIPGSVCYLSRLLVLRSRVHSASRTELGLEFMRWEEGSAAVNVAIPVLYCPLYCLSCHKLLTSNVGRLTWIRVTPLLQDWLYWLNGWTAGCTLVWLDEGPNKGSWPDWLKGRQTDWITDWQADWRMDLLEHRQRIGKRKDWMNKGDDGQRCGWMKDWLEEGLAQWRTHNKGVIIA